MSDGYLLGKTALDRRRSFSSKKLPCLSRSISIHSENQLPLMLDYKDIQIIEEIGQGAFGKVFKVKHKKIEEELVIKGVLSNSKECETSLLREVSLLQRLRHPNLLYSFGVMNHENQLWLVTEFVCAGSLQGFLLDRPQRFISWPTRISFASDVATAMAYLHEQGIVHRDLTSHNCLVRSDESVVVADLGLALLRRPRLGAFDETPGLSAPTKLLVEEDTPCSASFKLPIRNLTLLNSRRRTKHKYDVVGSSFWMAPEMFASKPYDEFVDIYSFGIILCQLIGRVDADPDVLERHSATLSINFANFLETHVPKDTPTEFTALAEVCTRCCPDERPSFAKCRSWLQGLRIFAI